MQRESSTVPASWSQRKGLLLFSSFVHRLAGWLVLARAVRPTDNGEGGIRTAGTVTRTHAFQACSFDRSDTSPSGEVGIRTLGTVAGTPVFETGPFDHSGTSPGYRGGDSTGEGFRRKPGAARRIPRRERPRTPRPGG